MLSRLTDRLVLCPSRDPLPLEDKIAHRLEYQDGHLEVFKMRVGDGPPQAYILKFGGAGSRAERAELHPADVWPHLNAEIWAVNYPGFGNSSGRASLRSLIHTADWTYQHLAAEAGIRPILVTGNSLGTTCALYLASKVRVAGLILRNPPPLRQLIVGRFGWWNLYLAAGLVAQGVPGELNSIRNATQCRVPAVFIMSGRDRVVPPRYQQRIHRAYAGPKKIVVDPEADHATLMDKSVEEEYRQALAWLEKQAFLPAGTADVEMASDQVASQFE